MSSSCMYSQNSNSLQSQSYLVKICLLAGIEGGVAESLLLLLLLLFFLIHGAFSGYFAVRVIITKYQRSVSSIAQVCFSMRC
jgi:Zn-dependent protease with chaperone function